VVVFGRAKIIEDREKIEEKARKLAIKYFPTMEEVEKELADSLDRVQIFAIDIEHMTGKLVKEK